MLAPSGTQYPKEQLPHILQLMKERVKCMEEFSSDVLAETNSFIQRGLASSLLKELNAIIRSTTAPLTDEDWRVHSIRSEILFYIFFNTQMELNEFELMREVVYNLTDFLDTLKSAENQSGISSLLNIVVNLHMTQIGAHQQTEPLLDRSMNYGNVETMKSIEVGNNIAQSAGDLYGLDQEQWSSTGAQGFTNLVMAIFRQPEVDMSAAQPGDVEWFLLEASVLRGYTYMRDVILPVIQATMLVDYQRAVHYMKLIDKFLENLAKMFVMSHYKHHASDEGIHFPYQLFPPDHTFYANNVDYYRKRYEMERHTNPFRRRRGRTSETAVLDVDTLHEIVLLFCEVVNLYPTFARAFWPETSDENGNPQTRDMQTVSSSLVRFEATQHDYHPFVLRFSLICQRYAGFENLALKFFTALVKGPRGCTALPAYHFLADTGVWRRYMEQFERLMEALLRDDDTVNISSSTWTMQSDIRSNQLRLALNRATSGRNLGASFGASAVGAAMPMTLTPHDFDDLRNIICLFSALAEHSSIASFLLNDYNILERLFNLLTSAVTTDIKGAVLSCITALVQHSRESSRRVWDMLESYGISPFRQQNNPSASAASSINNQGFLKELLETEPRQGKYPLTLSFLHLLKTLLKFTAPNELGADHRLPGITAYLELVMEEILFKAHERNYAPNTSTIMQSDIVGQRWKVTALALSVINGVLENYRLHVIDIETDRSLSQAAVIDPFLADFQEVIEEYCINGQVIRTARPKTAEFFLMSQVLSNSRLTEFILLVIKFTNKQFVEQQLMAHLNETFAVTVRILGEKHSLHPLMMSQSYITYSSDSSPSLSNEEVNILSASSDVFWLEHALSQAILILLNVSIREQRFIQLHDQCKEPLMLRKQEFGRMAMVPVTPHTIAKIVIGYNSVPSLLHIISQQFSCYPTIPSIEIIALRLLRYILIQQPGFVINTTNSMLSTSNGDSEALDIVQLLETFGAILYDDNGQSVIPLEPEFGDYYLLFDEQVRCPIQWMQVDNDEISLRAEVLDFMLLPLTPNRFSLIHQLLGFHRPTHAQYQKGCFEVILDLLNPKGHQLLMKSPKDATDCYELLYRIISSPVVKQEALKLLRDRTVDFFNLQLSLFVLVLENINAVNIDLYYLNHAFSWFVKLCTLELHTAAMESTLNLGSTSSLRAVLFAGLNSQRLQGLNQNYVVPSLLTMLEYVGSLIARCGEDIQRRTANNAHLAVTVVALKGGSGFVNNNPFQDLVGAGIEPTTHLIIDIEDYAKSLKETVQGRAFGDLSSAQAECEGMVLDQVNQNQRQRLAASLQHLCVALRQLLEYCFLTPCFDSTIVNDLGGVTHGQAIVENVLIPFLKQINEIQAVDMMIGEEVMRVTNAIIYRLTSLVGNDGICLTIAECLFEMLRKSSARGSGYHARIIQALSRLAKDSRNMSIMTLDNSNRGDGREKKVRETMSLMLTESSMMSSAEEEEKSGAKDMKTSCVVWNMMKYDAATIADRMLDVALHSTELYWQITALQSLQLFFRDGHDLDDHRWMTQVTSTLCDRRKLLQLLHGIFPLQQGLSIEGKVELLLAFLGLLSRVVEEVHNEQEAVSLREVLMAMAQIQEFDVFRLSSSLTGNTSNSPQVALHRAFLGFVDFFSHCLEGGRSDRNGNNVEMLQFAATFFQHNRQAFFSTLKLQNGPLNINELERVTAFVSITTRRNQKLVTSQVRSAEWSTSLWTAELEALNQDMFRVLFLLGDQQQDANIFSPSSGMSSSLATTVVSSSRNDIAGCFKSFGRTMETLLSQDAGDSEKQLVTAEKVLQCAAHAACYLCVAQQSSKEGITSRGLGSSTQQVDWAHRCITAAGSVLRVDPAVVAAIESAASTSNRQERPLQDLSPRQRKLLQVYELLLQIAENLLCSLYNRLEAARKARKMSEVADAEAAVGRLVQTAELLPQHSFGRMVVRWTRELLESVN